MLRNSGGAFVWALIEADGHALATYTSTGTQQSFEILGAYGDEGVAAMGVRHMRLADGLWLQQEPLLYLGPTVGPLAPTQSSLQWFPRDGFTKSIDRGAEWILGQVTARASISYSQLFAASLRTSRT